MTKIQNNFLVENFSKQIYSVEEAAENWLIIQKNLKLNKARFLKTHNVHGAIRETI